MDRHMQHSVFHTIAFLAFSCLAISTLASCCRKFMSRIFSVPSVVTHSLKNGNVILRPLSPVSSIICMHNVYARWYLWWWLVRHTFHLLPKSRPKFTSSGVTSVTSYQRPKTVKGAQSDQNYVSRLLANVCRGPKNYSYATVHILLSIKLWRTSRPTLKEWRLV